MSDLEFVATALQTESDCDCEDEDDAPSLSDFPLTGAAGVQVHERRCSLSESPDLFEFLTPDLNRNELDWPTSFSPPSSKLFSRSIKTLRSESLLESKTAHRSNRMDYTEQRRSSPPPWYWLALGPSRYPAEAAEVKLRSGFSRRQPRSPAKFFPGKEKASCDGSSWRLINALTCKSHRSVAATTPFHPYC